MAENLYPVFLVGIQRSGTNMTVGCLHRLKEVELFNENDPRAFVQFKLKDLREILALLESEKKS